MSQADPSRRVAWRVLEAVERDSNLMLDVALRRLGNNLEPRDAALARELVHGSMRMGLFYDAVLEPYFTKSDPPPALRRILRMAAHQMLGMDRIPPHAIGASTGAILRWGGQARLVGVANAIVRRLLGDIREHAEGADPQDRLPQRLLPRDRGLRFGLPSSFVRHLSAAGEDISDQRLSMCSHCPPLATRSLGKHRVPAETAGILHQDDMWTWWSDPQAAIRGPVRAGTAVVQDPAQYQTVQMAGDLQGKRVLDLCAAPGGKALAMSEGGARVIAADRAARRLTSLAKVLDQRDDLPARPALVVADGRRMALAPVFDLVLVDAPCSNSGVWGRRPEARYRYNPESLQALSEIQGALLRAASSAVKPGGHLMYATCSLTPAENREVVQMLPGWRICDEKTHWPSEFQAGGYACLMTSS